VLEVQAARVSLEVLPIKEVQLKSVVGLKVLRKLKRKVPAEMRVYSPEGVMMECRVIN
jgi:hypothetical protein